MSEERPVGVGRAALLSFAYIALGIFILAFSLAGGRFTAGIVALVMLTWAFQVRISRRPWGELGFSLHPRGLAEWLLGAVAGLALFSLVALVLWATRAVSFRLAPPQEFNPEILLVLGVSALLEELFFRGYPLTQLARALGATKALVLTSLLFAVVHLANPAPGPLPFLGVFLAGCAIGAAYLRWRTLWAAWGVHFAWNAAQGLLFGFPISGVTRQDVPELPLSTVLSASVHGPAWWTGGRFGPEGSLPALLILALAAKLLIHPPGWPSLEEIRRRDELSAPAIVPEGEGAMREDAPPAHPVSDEPYT